MISVISLGAGVQSTTLALMAAKGQIEPMPDCAIFADTQGEPEAVYKHLEWMMSPGVLPFPIHIVTVGNLWKSVIQVKRTKDGKRTYTGTSIPVYTRTDDEMTGIGRRHCTRNFKIDPVNRKIRQLLGLKRISSKSVKLASVWLGISLDEAMRKKPARLPWLEHRWPLLEQNMTRKDCYQWLKDHSYPEPPRSACTFCPYKSDDEWLRLTPLEFADAVNKEKQLQLAYEKSSALTSVPYLHKARIPLDQVVLIPGNKHKDKTYQIDLFNNECEGVCGT